jgi:hypothetical protein
LTPLRGIKPAAGKILSLPPGHVVFLPASPHAIRRRIEAGETAMGLDQFAFAFRADIVGDVQADLPIEPEERIHTWRKHPNLHGWMEQLYRTKGGRMDSFNCTTVRLDSADLDALEQAINDNALPETVGFFFGQSTPERKDDDLAFIAKARAVIARGLVVFYDSWW